MPYGRSRLQDYYERLLGGKPSNGDTEQDPVFPWLVPQPRPEPESKPEVTSVTPMVNIVSSNPSQPAQQTSPPGGRSAVSIAS